MDHGEFKWVSGLAGNQIHGFFSTRGWGGDPGRGCCIKGAPKSLLSPPHHLACTCSVGPVLLVAVNLITDGSKGVLAAVQVLVLPPASSPPESRVGTDERTVACGALPVIMYALEFLDHRRTRTLLLLLCVNQFHKGFSWSEAERSEEGPCGRVRLMESVRNDFFSRPAPSPSLFRIFTSAFR